MRRLSQYLATDSVTAAETSTAMAITSHMVNVCRPICAGSACGPSNGRGNVASGKEAATRTWEIAARHA